MHVHIWFGPISLERLWVWKALVQVCSSCESVWQSLFGFAFGPICIAFGFRPISLERLWVWKAFVAFAAGVSQFRSALHELHKSSKVCLARKDATKVLWVFGNLVLVEIRCI